MAADPFDRELLELQKILGRSVELYTVIARDIFAKPLWDDSFRRDLTKPWPAFL